MGARKLTRWQKASALVPMAVLVGAWGAALTNTGLANASNDSSDAGVPDVPTTAFDQPASIVSNPAGIDDKAGAAGALGSLSTNGIPAASLAAYRRAETLLGKADSSCKLPWTLVAAIGRVESNHGRTGGNSVNAEGVSTPGVYGIPLNGGNNTSKINDTDSGSLDNDSVYDRAVGPMQFIPGTWKSVAVDADNDKKKNPQDIDDAATSAGVYLCSGDGDLSTKDGASSAVLRYNHSSSYVDLVLKIASKYAEGDFTQSPNGYTSSTVLTSKSNDQTMTPAERKSAKKAEDKSKPKPGGDGGTDGSGGSDGGGGGSTGGSGGSTGGTDGGLGGIIPAPGGGGTGGGGGTPAPDPVTNTLTWAEAKAQCLASGISVLDLTKLTSCITNLLN